MALQRHSAVISMLSRRQLLWLLSIELSSCLLLCNDRWVAILRANNSHIWIQTLRYITASPHSTPNDVDLHQDISQMFSAKLWTLNGPLCRWVVTRLSYEYYYLDKGNIHLSSMSLANRTRPVVRLWTMSRVSLKTPVEHYDRSSFEYSTRSHLNWRCFFASLVDNHSTHRLKMTEKLKFIQLSIIWEDAIVIFFSDLSYFVLK